MNDKNYFIGSFYRRNNEIIFVDSEMRKTVAACSPQDTLMNLKVAALRFAALTINQTE